MPKLSYNNEDSIRRAIRDAYALDAIMPMKKLLEHLEKRFNHRFDHRYIGRLVKKVHAEATPNLDREKIENELRMFRETARINIERLTIVAMGQAVDGRDLPSYSEMATASRTIAMWMKMRLEAGIELGIFDKQKGPLLPDSFRFAPIPDEIRESMIITFRLWEMPAGLLREIKEIPAQVKDSPQKAPVEAPVSKQSEPKSKNGAIPSHGIVADPEFRLG